METLSPISCHMDPHRFEAFGRVREETVAPDQHDLLVDRSTLGLGLLDQLHRLFGL